MWKVIDRIVGEEVIFIEYADAVEEAERRVMIHGQEFSYKHRGYHSAIDCKIIEKKNEKTLEIVPK